MSWFKTLSPAQKKVQEATGNENWGTATSQFVGIAQMTFDMCVQGPSPSAAFAWEAASSDLSVRM